MAVLINPSLISTEPRDNAAKITALREDRIGHADLYRTIRSGPSGQTRSLRVGRIRWVYADSHPQEFRITGEDGTPAGWARWDLFKDAWTITREAADGTLTLEGYATSLAIGCDVLIHGVHAACGRHDARRTSGGTWTPFVPGQVRRG